MATEKKNNSDFLIQGSILAMASIISRIIGLIYRVPLTNILGDKGMDLYGAAYEIYNILLLISSYSLPLAVSKLVASRLSKGERTNAYRVFRGALLFAFITGSIASLIVFFFAHPLTVLLATESSYLALRVLGPTLLIVAIMGVIRGFFQGMGTMVPSAISQIIEQLVNAIVSVVAAYTLFQYGVRVGELLDSGESKGYEFGAAGGTLGTGCGALAALLFLCLVFFAFRRRFTKKMKFETKRTHESYRSIFRILILTIVPVLLSTTVYNISSILDQGLFKNIALFQGYSAEEVSTWWGIFTGKYKTLINVPIALASAMAASCVPSITGAHIIGNTKLVLRKIESSLRFVMLLAFPCAVGLAVLASPILQLLFSDSRAMSALMIQVGVISVLFYSISTLTNAVLQGIDHMAEPVKNAAIALVLHLLILVGMMFVLNLNIYAVILSNAIFALIMCLLNGRSIRKYVPYRQEMQKTFLIPLISSLMMGVATYFAYTLTMQLCNINALSTIFAIFVAFLVYGIAITRLHGVTESELRSFPKGTALVRIFKKLHLM